MSSGYVISAPVNFKAGGSVQIKLTNVNSSSGSTWTLGTNENDDMFISQNIQSGSLYLDGRNISSAGSLNNVSIPSTNTDSFLLCSQTQTVKNKNITDSSNNVVANSLRTNSAEVSVDLSLSNPPNENDVLMASSASSASWKPPPRTISLTSSKFTVEGSEIILGYFQWKNSTYSSYTTRNIITWIEPSTGTTPIKNHKVLNVEVKTITNDLLGTMEVDGTSASSGLFEFSFDAPDTDTCLIFSATTTTTEVNEEGDVWSYPNVYGLTIDLH